MEYQDLPPGSDFRRHEPRGPGVPPPGTKKEFEAKLDEVADRVSRTVSEGVRRLEEAASHIERDSAVQEGKVKKLFTSPMGGLIVAAIGILWFFNAVGLFRSWPAALIVIGIGIYMIFRFRSEEPL